MSIVGKVRALFSEDERALRKYSKWIRSLRINQEAVLVDQQNGLTLDGSMYCILRELLTNADYAHMDIRFATTRQNDKAFSQELARRGLSVQTVPRGSVAYAHALATSKYLFTDNTFPPYFVKRTGQVLVNTWHGIPLKALGRSERTDLTRCGNVQRNLALADWLLLPNPQMQEVMVRDYMLAGMCGARVLRMGYPRNEALLRGPDARTARAGRRSYAWLPTFRGAGSERGGEPEWLRPALATLDSLLQDDEVLYLKTHLVQGAPPDLSGYAHIERLPSDRELYEVLAECDALLTDYSSVMFDFPLGGGKVVLWAPDEEEYAAERGLYAPLDSLPFERARTVEEVASLLRSPQAIDDAPFMRECWPGPTEGATRALLQAALTGESKADAGQVVGPTETLVYSELSGDLLALQSRLDALGSSVPVRLCFPWRCGLGHEDFLYSLPASVQLTPLVGRMVTSLRQKAALHLAWHGVRPKPLGKTLDSCYALDRARQFGDARFRQVVVHDGEDQRWLGLMSWMS